MYKRFYHLIAFPFSLAPEPDFCFSHDNYKRARECLDNTLAQEEGIVLLTGQLGTGKTLLVEMFLTGINTGEVFARQITVSRFGPPTLLHAIAYACDIDAEGMDKGTTRQQIQQVLLQQEQSGRRVLLILDEAQNLSHADAEELRRLVDQQAQTSLTLQLFFVGDESLQKLMSTLAMEQFQQRIIASHQLVPLGLQDTRAYIEHRLLQADWKGDPEFSSAAVLKIYKLSKGVPRQINKICRRLLLLGYGQDKHAFDGQDVLEISAEMQDEGSLPPEINQAPPGDTDNAMSIPEIRDGKVSATGLAIRVNRKDASVAATVEDTRLPDEIETHFIDPHYISPAVRYEQINSPSIESDAARAASPDPLRSSNASHAAIQHLDDMAKKIRRADRPGWKKALSIAAVLLILLTVFTASVPIIQKTLGTLDEDGKMQVQDKKTDAGDDQAVVDTNNRDQARSEVPLVADAPVRATIATESIVQADVPARTTTTKGIAQADAVEAIKIEKLLAQGRQALDDYRLMTPRSNNAYEYLITVLQLDPTNEMARAGLQEIVDIYIAITTRAIDRNEFARARRYLERGFRIQPNNPELLALKDTVNSKKESVPVTRETPGTRRQVTRDNTGLQKRSILKKRQPADRITDVNRTGSDI